MGLDKKTHIMADIRAENIPEFIETFKDKTRHLDKPKVLQIIKSAKEILANEQVIQTFIHTDQITVVGDTHGQYYDLLKLFELNGLPSEKNAYCFNGDFVDRGKYGCEVLLTLLILKICYPDSVILNRGNHESEWCTRCYGFQREVDSKYDDEVYSAFCDLFKYLPLAAIIENEEPGKRVFVVHGGLYTDHEKYSLEWINENISKPNDTMFSLDAMTDPDLDDSDRDIKFQIYTDLMWSDPHQKIGMTYNSSRGQGQFWGSDQTMKFCKNNNIEYILRSHETVDGVKTHHGDRVYTVFSAPNYCGIQGNLGGVVVVKGPNMERHVTRYRMAEKSGEIDSETRYLKKLQALANSGDEEFSSACQLFNKFEDSSEDEQEELMENEGSPGFKFVNVESGPFKSHIVEQYQAKNHNLPKEIILLE